jgi:TolB-like protein/Tfp pilus assembly protein PilF
MPFAAGTRLGPYIVRDFIDAGGMGEVYGAHDPRLDRMVAIKVLPPQLAEVQEFRRRFEREMQAISRLNHKNICTIFDTGTHEGRPYIVMELMEGQTLEKSLASGPLEIDALLHIGIQVASALDAAHRDGVVHRDVKSANVFVGKRGDAKVLDFGIAKVRPAAGGSTRITRDDVTRAGIPVGTVAFMSPEQARGESVDARTDIFSLGIVLYEMATGGTPYRGTTTSILAQLVSPEPVPAPRTLNAALPVELDRVICRALEKDRDMRYQTSADLLAALRGVRRDLAARTTSGGVHGSSHSAPRSRRKPLTPILFGVVALLGVGLLARQLLTTGSLVPRPVESIAVLPCGDRQAGAGTEYLCDLIAERIIASLSQVPGFTVLSFQAVEPYAGDERGAIQVGRDLGVDAVLTALVREQGGNLDVTVEVTDVRNGVHLWGGYFQSPEANAQALHEAIAEDVTENLQLRLSATDRARLRVVQTYQQAQYFSDARTAVSLERAVGLFGEVIEADSTFARAYVGLASSYILLHYYGSLAPGEAYPRARAAAERALELDESLADAHASLGLVNRDFDRDWDGAEREFRRALQLDPRSTSSLQWYAELLAVVSRFDEAEARIAEAQRSAPLSLIVRAVHGWVLTSAGKTREARRQLEATLEMDPDFPQSNWFLGQLHFAEGNYGAALQSLGRAAELSGRASRMVADLAAAHARAGNGDRARELLQELETRLGQNGNVPRYEAAIVYAGLGELDRAFQELEAALDERTWQVVAMGIDPMLDPLRDDPRLQDLLRRVGLPAGA